MNELIKIQENNGIKTVNARDLWEALGSKQQFANWIASRIDGFIAESDFTVNRIINGKAVQYDYHLTIDTAKHIAMLERNEKGREIRQYFIEVEKKAREHFSVPGTYAEALQLAADQAKEIEKKNIELQIAKPKIEFFDAVTDSKDAVEMKTVAKVLNLGIGRNKLFELLREKAILDSRNQPYQQFIDRGYFRVIESQYTKPDGEIHISFKTVVYQKGIDYIRKIVKAGE